MSRFGSAVLVATATSLTFGLMAVPSSVAAAPPSVQVEKSALVYTVKNGDFLFGIAMKLSVKVSDLLAVNALTVTSAIHPGDQLAVPVGGSLPAEPAPATAAAPTTPAAASAPGVAGSGEYVVLKNDYLVGIAAKNGVTLKALLAANNMTVTSVIVPGRKLVVPPATLPIPTAATTVVAPLVTTTPAAPAATPAPAVGSGSYVVKSGDYFVAIAAANGVTLKALLAANNMTVASAIFPGTKLVVPAATLPIPAATPAVAAAPAADGSASPQQSKIATVLGFLQGELGKPYLFNSAGPDSYDCSGLVVAAYKQVGINLPHQSLLQSTKGVAVDWRAVDIQAGDLIFQIGTGKTYISHVGIAISSTQWIQAARAGDVVKISTIPIDDKIQAVRRIVN